MAHTRARARARADTHTHTHTHTYTQRACWVWTQSTIVKYYINNYISVYGTHTHTYARTHVHTLSLSLSLSLFGTNHPNTHTHESTYFCSSLVKSEPTSSVPRGAQIRRKKVLLFSMNTHRTTKRNPGRK